MEEDNDEDEKMKKWKDEKERKKRKERNLPEHATPTRGGIQNCRSECEFL